MDGSIECFSLESRGREKYTKLLVHMAGKPKTKDFIWRSNNNEVITGGDDGVITSWGASKGEQICVNVLHKKAITSMFFIESLNILISTGKDLRIKIWKLPD